MRRAVLALAAIVTAAATLSVAAPREAAAAAIVQADFLKASGNVLKKGSGTGATVNLRGTNVGGWLAQEDWMSPLGEFAVDRTGWVATASAGTASAALDGAAGTRWTPNVDQAPGQWYRVDLGAPTLFSRLSIDNTNFSGTYPRNVNVETSPDAVTWKSVANQAGLNGVTTVRFAPQVARYLRVTQTATAAALWSIGELNLFSDSSLFNGTHIASASSTQSGTTPGMAIDGNTSTIWQTGLPQAPGQWLTVDLGRNVDMDKMLFDSGAAAASDYPRIWDVYTSYDNVTFTHVASGYGTNRVVLADFQGGKNGRYLRIGSNGTSGSWWSVAEIAIYSGTAIDRGGWAVSSSAGANPQSMLDNNTGTRWTSGVAQAPGQTVTVDMGALVTLNNVTTDTAKNTTDEGDWARGFNLELSRNGTAWTTVASGAGTFKATTIGFVAQAARYFRLSTTASAAQWWSIGEVTAGLYNDDYSLNRTMETRFGNTGAQTIADAHHNAWLTTTDLDNIAATGMNFIRVPVSWHTFMQTNGAWKANPWTKIDWVIAEANARGMYVLLDLHTVPGGGCPWGSCGRIGPNPNGFWGSTTYQNWVVDIWKAIAARYNGNAGVAGYDLINEPLIDYGEDADDVAQKSAFYDRVYDEVRAIDANHTIYIAAFFGLDSIAPPSTYGWTNVVYEYHPYDMPGSKNWTAQETLVNNELAALPAKLSNPGVPILYGEYSLYYNDDLWAKWMAGLNAQSVSWSAWTYKVKGSASDGFAYWGMWYGNANPVPIINSDDSATFIAKVQRFGTANFTKNDRFVATLGKYAGPSGSNTGVTTFNPVWVSNVGWTATASSTAAGTSTAAGINGPNTSWATGQAMNGTEWYRLDMGANQTVAMVGVQTAAGSFDYPRGFTLQTSLDGTAWTTRATGIAYGWKRPISITPVTARYIRVLQTGVAPQWWSIDDLWVWSSY